MRKIVYILLAIQSFMISGSDLFMPINPSDMYPKEVCRNEMGRTSIESAIDTVYAWQPLSFLGKSMNRIHDGLLEYYPDASSEYVAMLQEKNLKLGIDIQGIKIKRLPQTDAELFSGLKDDQIYKKMFRKTISIDDSQAFVLGHYLVLNEKNFSYGNPCDEHTLIHESMHIKFNDSSNRFFLAIGSLFGFYKAMGYQLLKVFPQHRKKIMISSLCGAMVIMHNILKQEKKFVERRADTYAYYAMKSDVVDACAHSEECVEKIFPTLSENNKNGYLDSTQIYAIAEDLRKQGK